MKALLLTTIMAVLTGMSLTVGWARESAYTEPMAIVGPTLLDMPHKRYAGVSLEYVSPPPRQIRVSKPTGADSVKDSGPQLRNCFTQPLTAGSGGKVQVCDVY